MFKLVQAEVSYGTPKWYDVINSIEALDKGLMEVSEKFIKTEYFQNAAKIAIYNLTKVRPEDVSFEYKPRRQNMKGETIPSRVLLKASGIILTWKEEL